MKSLVFSIPVLALLLFSGSCGKSSVTVTTSEDTVDQSDTSISDVLYRADSARMDILRYDSLCTNVFGDSNVVKAFTIGATDLMTALGITKVTPQFNHVRAYLGYTANNDFKLFIVPVQGALGSGPLYTSPGKDVLLDSKGKPAPDTISLNKKYVLDLNAPCPSICDVNSPLTKK